MSTELVPHLEYPDEPDGDLCRCGIAAVTPAQAELLAKFDGWYGDKSYRKHQEVAEWASALTRPFIADLTAAREEVGKLRDSLDEWKLAYGVTEEARAHILKERAGLRDKVIGWVHVADSEDRTDWQIGYRACANRVRRLVEAHTRNWATPKTVTTPPTSPSPLDVTQAGEDDCGCPVERKPVQITHHTRECSVKIQAQEFAERHPELYADACSRCGGLDGQHTVRGCGEEQ